MRVVASRRRWSQVTGPPEAVGPRARFSRHFTLGYAPACRVEVEEHPVHEASLNRSVWIIDEQNQPGGPFGHVVPDEGGRNIALFMVEAGRDRCSRLERGTA